MSRFTRVVVLPLLALIPSVAGAQFRPAPRVAGDTVDQRPTPKGVPCTVACSRIEHETWRQFDSRIDVGLGGGAARIATGPVGTLTLPIAGAHAAWTQAFHDWSLGSSVRGWAMPGMQGTSGWGGSAMLRAAVPLFVSGTELHLGTGIGLDRITYGRNLQTTRYENVGLAYEAGVSQEFLQDDASRGVLLSVGVTGLQGGNGYPVTSGPMFVAALGFRWHRWTATQHETEGRYPRSAPRWPRPIP